MASQPSLFGDDEPAAGADTAVAPSAPDDDTRSLAAWLDTRWGGRLHLGTSSWHFPGWAGLVWARPEPATRLSREGLPAYAAHPLLRTVSLDRAFYRPLDPATYRGLAGQVARAPGFGFVVKAPAALTDALRRDGDSARPLGPNPGFLDPVAAVDTCVGPAVQGLGSALGAIVFQLSPLPVSWLAAPQALLDRLDAMLAAARAAAPAHVVLGVEWRDAEMATPSVARRLKAHGVRPVLGLHDRMPALPAQLPMLRAAWPGPLVCRWNLQRGQRYAQARDRWAPFDRLQAPDLPTREALARLLVSTLDAGQPAWVTINNKAEGSAPGSVLALAQALRRVVDGA